MRISVRHRLAYSTGLYDNTKRDKVDPISQMSTPNVFEGEVAFDVPSAGKPCKTWYKVVGDLATHRPLVALHGGPGIPHDYLEVLSGLTNTYDIPVIFYDQIGNGLSTHLPEKNGDIDFWGDKLWLDELDNLLVHLGIQDDYALIGHSWGGMLGARHATLQPKGLKQLIIADAPADMHDWVAAQNELKTRLPQDVQDLITKHENARTWEHKEYQDSNLIFSKQFLCRLEKWPDMMLKSMGWLEKDPTVYYTVLVASETCCQSLHTHLSAVMVLASSISLDH
jgi:proline-specific peptidase